MSVYASVREVPKVKGRYAVRIPVTTDLNGMEVVVWAHALVGSRTGPVLTLLSGLHGDEWGHLPFFRRFVQDFDPDQVCGTVLVVPIANAVAFGGLSRNVRDNSDSPDANRSFPGGKGRRFNWLADQVAETIAATILSHSNYLLDFHLGIWGCTMGSSIVGTDFSSPEVNEKSLNLSFAFGNPLIMAVPMVGHWPGPKSSQSYAGEVLGVPASGSMLGGAGFDLEQEQTWATANLRGIRNVMIHLGMMAGNLQLPERYLVYSSVQRISPNVGGLLVPVNQSETFGREITRGEVLGSILSPFTLETVEELVVPMDGYLAYWSRTYPVRPGEWAYAVVPKEHAGTRWVDAPGA